MIGMEELATIIRAAVLSARANIRNGKTVSLLLVAPFEQGKTSIAIENCGPSLILTDVTGIGLLEALQQNPLATHVIINDLSMAQGHRLSVNKLTVAVLNALAEEGTYKIAVPRLAYLDLQGRKVGVIACSVPDLLNDRRTWWYRSGFVSRVLCLRYSHSFSLRMKILTAIANGEDGEQSKALKVPDLDIYVSISFQQAQRILGIAMSVANEVREIGYRKEKQFRGLAAGHALLRSWKSPEVLSEDVNFIESVVPYLIAEREI